MFHGFNTPFTQCSMDVNSIQNILRPSGWARRLITACIAILHMGVLYANTSSQHRNNSTRRLHQMAAGRHHHDAADNKSMPTPQHHHDAVRDTAAA